MLSKLLWVGLGKQRDLSAPAAQLHNTKARGWPLSSRYHQLPCLNVAFSESLPVFIGSGGIIDGLLR